MKLFKQTSLMKKSLTVAIAAALSLPLAAVADSHKSDNSSSDTSSPYMMPDDSWISISGTVANVMADRFELDYGQGSVTVEMDDGDRDADAYALIDGDKVRVSGLIDDDFMEATKIEASSVHVEKLGTTFYASTADEEDWVDNYVITTPVVPAETQLRGTVTSVAPAVNEFTINSGSREITVDVTSMIYDPLDDEGYQQIEEGDLVSVTGDIDTGLFENQELQADTIVTLNS
ncbi:MAG: NirD/YgiW/YdeI family stress tolerance protein [Gammaproteobacteria bacterium]|nr:NirD/YgiW/YdeI family stress tolerance protein [Gammaproteobacteria bacterium]